MADWANVPIFEVQDMDLVCFLQLRRDAFIHECMLTESGRDYLERASRLKDVNPDRAALRGMFG